MFAPTPKTAAAALAMMAIGIIPAQAEFSSVCPEICFKGQSLLVTKCTIDGTPKDPNFEWSQFDLNKILEYNSGLPGLQYQLNGDAFADGCAECSMSGSVLSCNCGTIDLNSNMDDVTGRLCFANNEIAPICSPDTSYTC